MQIFISDKLNIKGLSYGKLLSVGENPELQDPDFPRTSQKWKVASWAFRSAKRSSCVKGVL